MSDIICKHGGYRRLKSFQLAQLVYDVTIRFCDRYIDKFSRTRDQMIQAARSGVQNIAEGSQASATSKKTELKLTQVARASLEELKLDYENFLRQNNLEQWTRQNPLRQKLIDQRCKTADEVATWISRQTHSSSTLSMSTMSTLSTMSTVHARPLSTSPTALYPEFSANAALVLITVACYLLDRQVKRLASDFESEGGFSERLYRVRSSKRKGE